jgi:hypothetical protein
LFSRQIRSFFSHSVGYSSIIKVIVLVLTWEKLIADWNVTSWKSCLLIRTLFPSSFDLVFGFFHVSTDKNVSKLGSISEKYDETMSLFDKILIFDLNKFYFFFMKL